MPTLAGLLAVAAVIAFLVVRFGDTPIERAEKLFVKRDLKELRAYAAQRLEKGDTNPLLYSYYAVAEFSTNAKSNLSGLLSNIRAVDARPVFRRDALRRIVEVGNKARAGEIIFAALNLEELLDAEMKSLAHTLLASDAPLTTADGALSELLKIFPETERRVGAKQLQFRSAPSTESEVLRRLGDGESLLLRATGPSVTVSGKRGHWAFVVDAQWISGWVFDAYLKHAPSE
ncbi:MAG: SH3 domain-containing protein [Spirochaetes bacterium]|nr:SH3 domain-containing protein [Spirochaetota bacterium]